MNFQISFANKKIKKTIGYSFFSVLLLVAVLVLVQLISPKEVAKGDVDGNNTDSVWSGTLGPAAINSSNSDVELVDKVSITQNPSTGEYQAGLSAGQTSGYIRSKVIDRSPSGPLKTWKELQLGISRPVGTTTSITVDVLCGSTSGEGCILNQTLLTNVPLTNDEYQLPASLNSKTKIKLQVNFSRPDTTNPISTMYNWQVFWEVDSGVSLLVSKSSGNPLPNTANPELQGDSWPGVNNFNQVTYFANYSLNRSVQNLRIEIPFPTGSYTPTSGSTKTYGSAFVGSGLVNTTCQNNTGVTVSCISAGASKVILSFGNVNPSVGSVSVTFKIKSGPPNQVIFKTKPSILGDDLAAITLPDDVLNIESRAFAGSVLIAPEYIAANRDFHYILRLAYQTTINRFQSDMFNPSYVLNYSTSNCISNTVTPVLFGSGATSINSDTSGRTITFNLISPITLPTPSLNYGVRLRANSSCNFSTGIPVTLTFNSEQNSSFIETKTTNGVFNGSSQTLLSKFDSSDIRRLDLSMDGPPALVGAGQRLDYKVRFEQRTSFPTNDFWALFRVPTNTTFVAADVPMPVLTSLGALANNWRIYYSTSTANPPPRGSGWTELTNGNPSNSSIPPCGGPYGCFANPAPAQKITWIKFELGGNAFQWDRHGNFDQVMGSVTVVTDNNANGTVTANAFVSSGSTCLAPCPFVHNINVNDQPYFNVIQTHCRTKTLYPASPYCGDISAASGGSYYSVSHVDNSHESGPNSRGDARDVKVRIRLPDFEFLDQTTPIDLSADDGPYARCIAQFSLADTNCPDRNENYQNPAPWLNPSKINCSASTGPTCYVEWDIPLMYSINKFPSKLPTKYGFYIKLNIRSGLIDQTKICENGIGPCYVNVLTSTPAPQNTNLPKLSPYTLTVASNPNLTIQKELAPSYSSPITFGTATRFRIHYRNLPPSTGAVSSVTVIERLPLYTEVQPSARMNLDPGFLPNNAGASSVAGVTAFYKLQDPNFPRTSDLPPPKDDPGWVQFTAGFNTASIPLIDWVKWERNFLFPIDSATTDGQDYFDLGLVDTGSPDDSVFTNKAFLLWTTGAGEQKIDSTAQVRVDTPGFVTTTNGNVGSVGDLGSNIDLSGSCSTLTNCHTSYLGIQGEIFENNFFNSFKDWLVEGYSFAANDTGGLKTNYAQMLKDYGKDAQVCTSEDADDGSNNGCLTGNEMVEKFVVSDGNTLKINNTTNYSGVPKIIFVDGGGSGSNDALEINVDLRIPGSETGLIFVVNGNINVAYGVTNLDGVYLVEGQFSTGRRTQESTNGQAGQFATISIGRDGFARIAYVSGNNVRFIKCLDIACTTKDYGYVTTVVGNEVVSVNMGLYETPYGATIDYPKIVVGMRNADGAVTKFISCYDKDTNTNGHKEGETCLDNDTVLYQNANDPDIIVASDSIPAYLFGTGPSGDRALSIATCRINWPAADDPNCPSPNVSNIDGGSGVDKGNEANFSNDPTTGAFGSLVATYVDRSSGRSDLWFTKLRYDNLGTGCSSVTNWDCRRIVGTDATAGKVGPYHASTTSLQSGITRSAYVDSENSQLRYVQCTAKACTAFNNISIDCNSGCQGNGYVSIATFGIYTDIVYNAKNGSNDEVKLAFCWSSCGTNPVQWARIPISNNPQPSPNGYVTTKAKIYTQSVALGRNIEANVPRVVFFDQQAGNNFLVYARCIDVSCAPSSILYTLIDDGTAISLPDRQLNLNGSVLAYGAGISLTDQAINLQRDLFAESTSKPGEIFNFQPKYYYVFRQIIREPQRTSEVPP